ncbi:hypothetical protein [Thalassobacillus sp. CUG 92003]|uniref:hypothetical protein n=1 Tax=Thalassobacillus sp. CUG 92003 TaxID=2736641 RepID=UPI0015E78E92|nr:hypothetical protein [Thalassobacillus sp. CUG 92003]
MYPYYYVVPHPYIRDYYQLQPFYYSVPESYAIPHPSRPELPDVDPGLFSESAGKMQTLMGEAEPVLQRLNQSEEFAGEVMHAAQESDESKVKQLLNSTGIQSDFEVHFNPDNINIKLTATVNSMDCCHLTMALRWRA